MPRSTISPSGTDAASTYERADSVACERGEALLVAPVVAGSVRLEAIVALRDRARELWQTLPPRTSLQAVRAQLAGASAADADAFVAQLVGAGLLRGDVPPATPSPGVTGPAPAVTLEAADVEACARAVLTAGHRLSLCARGRSMRPWLPDGSRLEVAPIPFARVRLGDIAFYCAGPHRLVAHRVVGRRGDRLLTRGDSAARLDVPSAADYLGVVVARIDARGQRVALTTFARRAAGLIAGVVHRAGSAALRALVVRPLRRSSWLRRACSLPLRLASGALLRVERLAGRLRRRVDIARSGLMTTTEKDADRRRLYAGKAVREFTALDENVTAGLTLIEEVLVARHLAPPARLLVLGCGPGRECVALARRGFTVTGLDRDEGMLAAARALAAREVLAIRFVQGEADDFALADETFDRVVAFSGLYNMLLPRARRVALLRAARVHLRADGELLLTFLSDYVPPDRPAPLPTAGVLQAINPDHEDGDRYLLNEAVHVFPHPDAVAAEARAAGFTVKEIHRDQRAYDRATRQVRGYAVLVPAG